MQAVAGGAELPKLAEQPPATLVPSQLPTAAALGQQHQGGLVCLQPAISPLLPSERRQQLEELEQEMVMSDAWSHLVTGCLLSYLGRLCIFKFNCLLHDLPRDLRPQLMKAATGEIARLLFSGTPSRAVHGATAACEAAA
jgi:hypothetical protein